MTRQELTICLREDLLAYPTLATPIKRFYAFLCGDRDYYVFRYLQLLRHTEFFFSKKHQNPIYYIPYIYYKGKKNRLGQRLSIDIGECTFASGLYIAHTGIIAGSVKVGKNCKLHGQNCIGSGAVLGNNCELWVGAKIIGPAHLADGITVAAGAVVIDSFDKKNITIGGIPARRIK